MATHRALNCLLRTGVLAAATLLLPAALVASDPIKGVRPFNSQHRTVEIFPAAAAGELDVRLVAASSAECRLLIANKTEKPLNVRLPVALAAVPVLAQRFPDFPNADQAESRNAPQQLGIGNPFGIQEGGNRPLFDVGGERNRPPNPFFAPFNVAPEAVAQLRLSAVCLEPGKAEPRPAVPYQLRPLESVTGEPGVGELCAMLAHGEVGQKAAQAAAWHLNNRLSWDQLRAKRYKVAFGHTRPLFTKREMAEAEEAAAKALEAAGAGASEEKSNSLAAR